MRIGIFCLVLLLLLTGCTAEDRREELVVPSSDASLLPATKDNSVEPVDPVVNDLDRTLRTLADAYDAEHTTFDALLDFLAAEQTFLELPRHADEVKIIEMLRAGFDLDGTKERILILYALADGALDNDSTLDSLGDGLGALIELDDGMAKFLLYSLAANAETPEIPVDPEGFAGYAYGKHDAIVMLCCLYPGFLPENGTQTIDDTTFQTDISPQTDGYTVTLTMKNGESSSQWTYSVTDRAAILLSGESDFA